MTAIEDQAQVLDDLQRPAPRNIIEALARVKLEIGGIAKLTQAQRKALGHQTGDQGVAYAFRGIDQIAAQAQPLFGEYCVVIVPWVAKQNVVEITVNSKPWTDTFVTVDWSIYGPGGLTDVMGARTTGQGRDNSDKGVSKAMTTAYKNLLLRLLCIGDPKDDTDQHEAAERSTAPPPPPPAPVDGPVSAEYVEQVQEAAAKLGASLEDVAEWVRKATAGRKDGPTSVLEELLRTETPNLRAARDEWHVKQPPTTPTLALEGAQ